MVRHEKIKTSSGFKKSFKRVSKYPNFKKQKFDEIILLLLEDKELPLSCKDHALHGDLLGLRDCHISPDIVLIYKKDDLVLYLELVDIGKHSNIFG